MSTIARDEFSASDGGPPFRSLWASDGKPCLYARTELRMASNAGNRSFHSRSEILVLQLKTWGIAAGNAFA